MLEFLEQYIAERKVNETIYGEILADDLRAVFKLLESQHHSGMSWSIMIEMIGDADRAYDEYIIKKLARSHE